VYKFYS